ncbi:sulfur oxidation c-type cytochrome SoxX [Teichococcus vastitatis]|uniref:Sulfur oxidation c-type cytochrome SoxX n=1 Tax=Teichococcus vastitatis TaxID=2307076 RepID=A0ABS9W6K5_9PROT|nr:sulfur oxidation c-type cytochrome SoxX [Pseudoroseomonas vastitatis]MCI0754926.1 sulfur oxidation c-type cytochrome SoxX [Pseudoroseomonas vastitatis]
MLTLCLLAVPAAAQVAPFTVTEDAIEAPLDGLRGDWARGEAVVRNRETANCLICHTIPGVAERFMGEVGPPLAGVGSRLSPGQIRLRVVDPTLWNPQAIMPAYHRMEGLLRVDPRYRGRPVLTAQEVEDVVAYLSALEVQER